ncbi:MAG: hypothetical protein U1G07_14065 [Verrucomicrobiota bacterium]
MSNAVKYIAEPKHVREVSLLGTADLAFWAERLRQARLVPVDHRGKARILVTAAEMSYVGVPFTEASFSIFVCVPEQEDQQEAALLLQGFNSSRLLAWCERRLFATPYQHSRCHASVAPTASIQIIAGEQILFEAQMRRGAVSPRHPLSSRAHGFEGPVFLPSAESGDDRVFYVRIRGHTLTYPFVPGEDALRLVGNGTAGVLPDLVSSGFAGEEWVVRMDAAHARSKTYRRAHLLAARSIE